MADDDKPRKYEPGSTAAKLAALMDAKGYNALSLAEAAGKGARSTAVQDIISGKVKKPSADTLAQLARPLGVTVLDLLPDQGGGRPLRLDAGPGAEPQAFPGGLVVSVAVGARGGDLDPDDRLAVPVPRKWRDAPGLIAAMVKDESAGRLYPPGSVVVVCPLDQLGRPLADGDKVLALVFDGPRAAGHPISHLVMRLTVSADGDLLLSCPASTRELAATITLPRYTGGDYQPQPEDAAEILGAVVGAWIED